VIRPRDRFEAGPFGVEAIRVTHSIVDGIGLAITTPAGTIVHTGDFKLDPSPLDGELPDYRRFTELGDQGVLVLCSDSTNVDRPGHTRSEMDVGQALGDRFDVAKGRIIVATFASHIHRIQHVLTLAARTNRKVALPGHEHAAQRRDRLGARLLRVPTTSWSGSRSSGDLPPDRQVILSTGARASRIRRWRSWRPRSTSTSGSSAATS
jgi:ribonuclease J